ncbi:hypothetical protein HHK36_000475 [Tetracentron sinense]|uniref:RPN1 N-terminal domain-containing protein n=1 Tax=Tetracentron sinense TaxID=13715 RepID=A0A835A1Q5_TETSI|nr:hypothetical protein HHK36_000475 [Tetracentron sinense]
MRSVAVFEVDAKDDESKLKGERSEAMKASIIDALSSIQRSIARKRQGIRTPTSSVNSIPKPLKFLCPHYGTLKAYYETMRDSDVKEYMADILSVLALTMSAEGEQESLKYRLLGSVGNNIDSWGHAYVRNLAGEISQEYAKRQEIVDYYNVDDIMELVDHIVTFHLEHNAESEAVDLLAEVDELTMLNERVDAKNYKRTCLYLVSLASYLPDPEDILADVAYEIYLNFEDFPSALRIALFLRNSTYVRKVFVSCDDLLQKQQLCYILARHGIYFALNDYMVEDENERETLQEILYNTKLSEAFLTLARDIEVMEPKSPIDIYKS